MKSTVFVTLLSIFILSSPGFAAEATVNPPPKVESLIKQVEASDKINLNQADVKQLSKSVKGIGLKRAEAIIKYREANKGFKSIEELAQVPGLGSNFVQKHLVELEQKFTV